MKKLVSLITLFLVLVGFSGFVAASTVTNSYTSSSWETTDHPSIGKIVYKETVTSVMKTKGYSDTTKQTIIGKVISYTKTTIKVRCVETTVETSYDSYLGKSVQKSTTVSYMKLYRD